MVLSTEQYEADDFNVRDGSSSSDDDDDELANARRSNNGIIVLAAAPPPTLPWRRPTSNLPRRAKQKRFRLLADKVINPFCCNDEQ
jgi:hypothetical protein